MSRQAQAAIQDLCICLLRRRLNHYAIQWTTPVPETAHTFSDEFKDALYSHMYSFYNSIHPPEELCHRLSAMTEEDDWPAVLELFLIGVNILCGPPFFWRNIFNLMCWAYGMVTCFRSSSWCSRLANLTSILLATSVNYWKELIDDIGGWDEFLTKIEETDPYENKMYGRLLDFLLLNALKDVLIR